MEFKAHGAIVDVCLELNVQYKHQHVVQADHWGTKKERNSMVTLSLIG